MKRTILSLFLGLTALLVFTTALTSCNRSSCEVWEDTKTCGRYMGKGFRSFFGQHNDSGEYARYYEQWDSDHFADFQEEYIPLADSETLQLSIKEYALSSESPGEPGSKIPGIEKFADPSGELAQLFKKIHFETDHYAIKGSENVATLCTIANYLIKHPKTYIFVAGHADERGAAAYNLALGSKRAHAVRAFLIDNGVNSEQLFTISYGLERPIALEHNESAWHQNRRAEFKLYER